MSEPKTQAPTRESLRDAKRQLARQMIDARERKDSFTDAVKEAILEFEECRRGIEAIDAVLRHGHLRREAAP